MKVKNLIEELQKYDPETRVVLPGYEGGYKDVGYVSESELALNVHDEWYYGAHEDPDFADYYKESYVIEKSVIIS